MIDEILNDELKAIIVQQIQIQFSKFKQYQQVQSQIFYEPYTAIRRKHNLTAAIISGFAPERFVKPGITVSDIYYGLHNKMCQPELKTADVVMQIYSNGSDLKGKIIKDRCQKYNCSNSARPKFLLIMFYSNPENDLIKIEAQYPDANGNVVETQELYTNIVQIANVG